MKYKVPYDSNTVSSQDVKNALTSEITEELTRMSEKILVLPQREEKAVKLEELKKTASEPTVKFLELTALREIQHFDFMNYMLECKLSKFTDDVRSRRNVHDFSKDNLFYFGLAGFFNGKVQTAEMERFKTSELDRHYLKESHHPEFEKFNDAECNDFDIIEMAVDRLARNLQNGNGVINMGVMKKFLPRFPKGDNEAKQELFWKYCEEYADIVQEEFRRMFPDTEEWSRQN